MVMSRRLPAFARLAAALALLVPALGSAHIAEFEAVLDTAQEVPAPVGTNPGAGSTTMPAEFELEDDGTVVARVEYQGLTGAPVAAHIHQGAPGVPGGIVTGFGASLTGLGPAGTLEGSGDTPLSPAQQQVLFAGGMYFNIHTAQNTGGEIRGQIRLKAGTCPCDGAANPGSFKRCVKRAIQQIEPAERGEESVKALKRLVAKSKCGKTRTPRRLVGCCLPLSPAQNIVTQQMCATLKEAQCTRRGGTSVGAGVPCNPYPCGTGSPFGAFVEASAD
jgi:hypothetical protein